MEGTNDLFFDNDYSNNNKGITVKVKKYNEEELIPVVVPICANVDDFKSILHAALDDGLPDNAKLITEGKFPLQDDMATFKSLAAAEVLTNGTVIIIYPSDYILRDQSEDTINLKLTRAMETGIIDLHYFSLTAIPDAVWKCGNSAMCLGMKRNLIREIPAKISCLTSLQILTLMGNHLSNGSINWEGLVSLRHLIVLDLRYNDLEVIPPALGAMTSLQHLKLSGCRLSSLPTEIGLLTQLEVLRIDENRISTIPTSIGNCTSLVEVDFSENFIKEMPETICNLRNLKALNLSNNNNLKSLPSTLFKMCSQLKTFGFDYTGITIDVLLQLEGWEDYVEREAV